MTKFQLTPAGKIVVFILISAIVFGATFYLGGFDFLIGKIHKESDVKVTQQSKQTLNISLDEWVGWKPIIDANGGLETKAGSIYDKLGLKVSIKVINDATQSSTALIKGEIDGAGYTVNRFAFLYPKFKENKVQPVMPYITNSSTGGDGIIAKSNIKRIEDLVGKSIAVPRFSESQTLVEWLLAKSDLTPDQKKQIKFVYFNDAEEAGKAFYAGQVDAAATWQPYISQASDTPGAHILFSTKAATNIILDGIVFRKDFADSHREQVAKLIEGALMAQNMYKDAQTFKTLKNTFPMVAGMEDKDIAGMTDDATLTDFAGNVTLMNGIAQTLFTDMSNVWKSLGEKAMPEEAKNAFDPSFMQALNGKFSNTSNQIPKITEDQRNTVKDQSALLTKKAVIQFKVNSDEFVDKDLAYNALGEFVNIAKLMDNTVIQVEGNTSSDGDPVLNKELSAKRAKAIATYLKYQGIDPSRFIVIGNGDSKPIGDNNTQAGKEANRRTEVFFKTVK